MFVYYCVVSLCVCVVFLFLKLTHTHTHNAFNVSVVIQNIKGILIRYVVSYICI